MSDMNRDRQSAGSPSRPLKEVALFLLDILYNAVVIVVLVVVIRTFLISPFRVIGSSMADTLHNNEFIIIDKLSYHLDEPDRGDPIVFLPPVTNKNIEKFSDRITTEPDGKAMLDTSGLRAPKKVFYCQNPLVQRLWLCQDSVREGDLLFYREVSETGNGSDLGWKLSEKRLISKEEAGANRLLIQGKPDEDYELRIYSPTGPEYFVKRIIGVPGDTVRIDGGRVFLKKPGDEEFSELSEEYLMEENVNKTFLSRTSDIKEFVVPEEHFFVLGDNRGHSNDSRHWFSPIDEKASPFVAHDNISGKVLVVLWPPDDFRLIESGVLE